MSEQRFEPEVLALLDEIARSPDATMLRIPRERLLRYVGRPEETISPHGSWLTKAEKHLVTAYREQAARVLLEACVLRLREDPQFSSTIVVNRKSLRSRAARVAQRLATTDGPADILESLAKGRELTATELAGASVRLAPTVLGSVAVALGYLHEGNVKASIRANQATLKCRPPSRLRAQVLENMAGAHARQQDFMTAYELDLQASLVDPGRLRFVVWCFTDALQAGEEKEVLGSAKRLDAHFEGDEFDPILRAMKLSRKMRAWTPTKKATGLAARIRGHLSERSEAICAAFS